MPITRQARTLYSDFVEYKELDRAPLTSIHPGILVAFDSTALASLYNYPTHISDEILRAYSQLRGHAFLPHQALKEFWAALDGASPVPAAAERVRSALASFKETLPEERNSPWSALRSVTHQLDHSIAQIMRILEPTTDTGSINVARREDDTILPRLNRIFTGHVGAAPSPERHEQQCREALAQGHPLLANSSFDADFALWNQCVTEATTRVKGTDCVFVTGGVRDTWLRNGQQVRAASGGEPVHQLANRQLLREYAKATGGGVFRIYTVEEILRLASNQYGVTVSDATYSAIRAEQPVAV